MRAEMQDINFSLNLFFHAQLFDLGFVQDLHCNFVTCYSMGSEFDLQQHREREKKHAPPRDQEQKQQQREQC